MHNRKPSSVRPFISGRLMEVAVNSSLRRRRNLAQVSVNFHLWRRLVIRVYIDSILLKIIFGTVTKVCMCKFDSATYFSVCLS